MRLGITARFVAAVVTAAVAPLLVYGLVSIYSLRTGNETSVAEGNLNVARRVAQQIEQYMDSNVKVLRAVAAELRHTELRTWQQDRIVKNYVLDFREFRELTLFAADRTVVASSRLSATSLRVPSDADRDTRTIAPIAVDDDFLPTTTITIPLSRLGRRDGWLVGEVSLEELWRMVDGIRVGAEGFALLVAEDGRLLAHGRPDEKARVAAGENLSDHELVAAMTGSSRISASPTLATAQTLPAGDRTLHLKYEAPDGRMLLGVAAPVASLGWTVIVEQPTSEAFALAEQLQLELVFIISLALIATVTLGYYWGQSFIKPIFALMRGTEAISAGRLDDRVAIGGHDEFHQLGEAFNGMADNLIELKADVRKQERQAMFGRIAAGLVHDISHPIQNIANSCRLILKLREDAEYRGTFQRTVDREFASIKRVLDDLRNLARPMPLERFPVDVNRADPGYSRLHGIAGRDRRRRPQERVEPAPTVCGRRPLRAGAGVSKPDRQCHRGDLARRVDYRHHHRPWYSSANFRQRHRARHPTRAPRCDLRGLQHHETTRIRARLGDLAKDRGATRWHDLGHQPSRRGHDLRDRVPEDGKPPVSEGSRGQLVLQRNLDTTTSWGRVWALTSVRAVMNATRSRPGDYSASRLRPTRTWVWTRLARQD